MIPILLALGAVYLYNRASGPVNIATVASGNLTDTLQTIFNVRQENPPVTPSFLGDLRIVMSGGQSSPASGSAGGPVGSGFNSGQGTGLGGGKIIFNG